MFSSGSRGAARIMRSGNPESKLVASSGADRLEARSPLLEKTFEKTSRSVKIDNDVPDREHRHPGESPRNYAIAAINNCDTLKNSLL